MRVLALLSLATAAWGDPVPAVKKIVGEISQERIAAIMKKLESFGTRESSSPRDLPDKGVGAAQRWIEAELKSYSTRLEVRTDKYQIKKVNRLKGDTEIANVIAVLRGTTQPDVQVMISAHYDSVAYLRKPDNTIDWEATWANPTAPGVADDASGVAAVMELARVFSKYEFEKTVVFAAFDAEEIGLIGAKQHAEKAKADKVKIEALLNNDIIGTDTAASGTRISHYVNVYSDAPDDGVSRSLARYVRDAAERYLDSLKVQNVSRRDRFGRGGDHTAFHGAGFAAVRLTTPAENLKNQHTVNDTFENSSPAYTTQVAKVNAAALASLALAPKPPLLKRLGRGETSEDAVLNWDDSSAEPDVADYVVVVRPTTAANWEKSIPVGKVNTYKLAKVNIDEVVIGLKAVDQQGNESIVSAWTVPSFNLP